MTVTSEAGKGTISGGTLRFRPALIAVALGILSGPCVAHAADLDQVVVFDIKAEALSQALLDFGTQSHLRIMFAPSPTAAQLRTAELKGEYTARRALILLLKGTSFRFYNQGDIVEIRQSPSMDPATQLRVQPSDSHAARPPGSTSIADPRELNEGSSARRQAARNGALQEVIVTGTLIVGAETIASPMTTYSRRQIYAEGRGTIADFMKTLPATLEDANQLAVGATPNGPANLLDNSSEAVGFDLRGLGPQSTLVLVNGQRLAPGNFNGNFVDVSLIPLNIISHIDVLKDGASANYGADAVAGVVNIDTLQGFNGSESSVRYGSTVSGARRELQADETWGTDWSGGSAAMGYEYEDQTPLDAASRSFTANLLSPYTLLPQQARHGLYGSFTEFAIPDVKLTGFVLYGHRTDLSDQVSDGIIYQGTTHVDSFIASVDAQAALSSGGVATASIDYSGNDTDFNEVTKLYGSTTSLKPYDSPTGRSGLTTLNLGYSGSFGHVQGGSIGFAGGVQGFDEKFSYENSWAGLASYEKSRTVLAEYLEVAVPVAQSIHLDAAVRHERYSDFGDTTNPKVGLQWAMGRSVELDGTYSTSFVAPSPNELGSSAPSVYLPLPDPQRSGPCSFVDTAQRQGCATVLVASGGNANLGPEKADTWTTSVRVHPANVSGFRGELSLYSIQERNVINTAFAFIPSVLDCLQYAGELGAKVVNTNVTQQELAQAFPQAINPFGLDESGVSALCDGRDLNISKLSTRGLDADVRYAKTLAGVETTSTLSGTRILEYRTRITSSAPSTNFLNTPNNPVSLRIRYGESITIDRVTGSFYLNYVGPYTNNVVAPAEPIASWTTVDLVASYSQHFGMSSARGMTLTLGVDNLMDRDPPFLRNVAPGFPINFDGANASPLGRYVYAALRVDL